MTTKRSNARRVAAFAILGLFTMGATACGSSPSGSSGGGGSSYQGPGSAYTVDLQTDGTFTITIATDLDTTPHTTVNGTYTRHASGFVELTVVSASGTDAPNPGDQAIALEIPGFAFLLKPLDGDGELVPMVVAGQCPASDFTANWFMTTCNSSGTPCDASDTSRGFLGVFHYDAASLTASLPAEYAVADGSAQTTNPLGSASCSDGVMSVSGALMYLTSVGGAIVEISPDDHDEAQHVVGLIQENLTLSDLEGSYAGLVFDKNDDSTFAVNIDVASGGTSATVFQVDESNLASATNGTSLATLSFTSANDVSGTSADGWITGTLDNGSDPARPIYCMAATDIVGTSRDMMLCIGQSPGDATRTYNTVLVSKS